MIYGERVRLRPVEKDDLPRFVKWFADPEVRHYLGAHLSFSLGQEEQWYERNLKAGDSQALAIDIQPKAGLGTWTPIGSCGFNEIDWRNRSAELGIVIGAREVWSQGYGTDVVRTLVEWGFATLNLNRIWLRVFADNARGIRCYTKVGFKEEGRLRQGDYRQGAYRDVVLMSILREEWQG